MTTEQRPLQHTKRINVSGGAPAKRLVALAVVAALASFASGCAAFRSLEPVESWPPAPDGQPKSIGVVITGLGGELDTKFRAQAIKAFREAPVFSRVEENHRGTTDLRATVRIKHRGEGNVFWAMLTGLTLYVIPSTAWDEFTVETTFTDGADNPVGVVEVQDRVTLWQQLFLAFVWPFAQPDAQTESAFYDLMRTTIVDARAQGLYRAPEQPTATD